jgi:hypothetical protein
MGDEAGPQLVGQGVVVCCGFRYEVRDDDMYLEADAQQWHGAERDDPFWPTYWGPVAQTPTGNLQGPFETGALHTKGLLAAGDDLLSITVHDWATSAWVEVPFAVARGRLWVAHLPRWPIAARIKTTSGIDERTWRHRRYADFETDMPDGLNQIPPTTESEDPPGDGFGWITS